MKQETLPKLYRILTVLVVLVLVLVPFHAFLTVWAASLFGHYTAFRLWDEVVLLLASLAAASILIIKPKIWKALTKQHLFWLIVAYATLEFAIGGVAYARHDVTAKALGYGFVVNLRFLLFLLVCLVAAAHTGWLKKHWKQLLLIPAAVVVVFGLLQYFALPHDFLRHFGYSSKTIFPYETINHNVKYIRVMSTLRGANPLGAYLVIVTTALAVLLTKEKIKKWRIIYALFFAASLGCLYLSFSRSAWLGAVLSLLVAAGFSIKNAKIKRLGLMALVGLVIIGIAGALTFRNNVRVENILTHTQAHSAVKTTSDQGHVSALKAGLKDAAREPFGRGPGTAGPASFYNDGKARIAENYFIQIAQEVGWLGLILFVLINWLGGKGLWLVREDPLALSLLASLVGISLVGLLSHVWVDDTLSYLWWGLAGITLSPLINYEKPDKKPRL